MRIIFLIMLTLCFGAWADDQISKEPESGDLISTGPEDTPPKNFLHLVETTRELLGPADDKESDRNNDKL